MMLVIIIELCFFKFNNKTICYTAGIPFNMFTLITFSEDT